MIARRRRVLGAAVAAGAAVAGLGAPWVHAQTGRPVRVGLLSSLSGVGAVYGVDLLRGARMAVDEINAAGGVLGRPLELVVRDGGTQPARSALAMRELSLGDIDVVVGGWGSAQVLASLEMAEQLGQPFIVTGATHPAITTPRNRWTFRVVTDDSHATAAIAQAVVDELKLRRIAVVDDGSAYGTGCRDAFRTALDRRRLQPQLAVTYAPGAANYDALVRSVLAARPDAVALFGTVPSATQVLRALRRGGLQALAFGTGGLAHQQILDGAGADAEGLLVTGLFHEDLDAESAAWLARYRSLADPAGVPPQQPALAAWTFRALRDILVPCLDPSTLRDRDALRMRLGAWRGRLFGVRGEAYFDAERQLVQPVVLQQVRSGRFTLWRAA